MHTTGTYAGEGFGRTALCLAKACATKCEHGFIHVRLRCTIILMGIQWSPISISLCTRTVFSRTCVHRSTYTCAKEDCLISNINISNNYIRSTLSWETATFLYFVVSLWCLKGLRSHKKRVWRWPSILWCRGWGLRTLEGQVACMKMIIPNADN